MTQEEARKAAEVMMAYADGKEIEFKIKGEDRWETWDGRDTLGFEFDDVDYRIKKEPIYRPFKDKEECWAEMQKHQPFGWVCYYGRFINITNIDNKGIVFQCKIDSDTVNLDTLEYQDSLKHMKFVDGTPFGVKEN